MNWERFNRIVNHSFLRVFPGLDFASAGLFLGLVLPPDHVIQMILNISCKLALVIGTSLREHSSIERSRI